MIPDYSCQYNSISAIPNVAFGRVGFLFLFGARITQNHRIYLKPFWFMSPNFLVNTTAGYGTFLSNSTRAMMAYSSKSYCSVEGYYGSLNREHGVLKDICDDHVIWRQGGSERNGSKNLCTLVMTHNDLCTCIALTKWDGSIACVYVTENVETFQRRCYHFTATQTPVRVSVKQNGRNRVTCCTFSVDLKEIKTILQSLPSTCVVCLQPQQSGRHRGEIETPQLSGTVMFSCDQAALQMVFSVCLSVRLSVRPSVRHTFFTMFPSSYHHEIFRSYYHGQKWCPCKRSRSEVKGQGHRGQHPT